MKRIIYGCLVVLACIGKMVVSADAKDRLATGYTATSGIFAGLWVAQEARLFEKYDIESNPVLIPTASRMVQSMLGGDVAFSGAGGNAAVEATLAGGDFVMVGSLAKVPAFYIMALPEIKSIEELRGKAVGVTRFGSSSCSWPSTCVGPLLRCDWTTFVLMWCWPSLTTSKRCVATARPLATAGWPRSTASWRTCCAMT